MREFPVEGFMRRFNGARWVVLTILGVLAGVSPAAAQMSGGFKGGVTFSTVATDPDAPGGLGSRIDFAAGGFIVLNPESRVTAQIEGMLSRRGAKLTADVFDLGLGLGDIRLTYFDVSAFARFRLGGSGREHVFVVAGPTISMKIDAEFIVLGFATDISPGIEDFDLGLTVGAGVDARYLLVEGRYTHGLRNIVIGAEFAGIKVKNQSFAFLAGIKF
jgi:hypothetical protein